jgi:hypothetical protein
VVSVLTPAEILIAARRLAAARPHLAAVAGIVHQDDLWQLCRDELDRRPRRWLGYPRPLIRGGCRGHAAARGVAARRDDPLARDRCPHRTARTRQLALTRSNPALTGESTNALAAQPSIFGGTTRIMKEVIGRNLGL